MSEFDEALDNLRKAGGGIVAAIVVKNGEFTRTIYQEATIENKNDLKSVLDNLHNAFSDDFHVVPILDDDELKR